MRAVFPCCHSTAEAQRSAYLDLLLLFVSCLLQRCADEPGALVVLNVRTDLTNVLWVPVTV